MSLVTFFLLVVETSNFRHLKKPLNWRQNYLYYILLSIETCFNDVIFTKLQTDPYHEIRPTMPSHDSCNNINKKGLKPFRLFKTHLFPC